MHTNGTDAVFENRPTLGRYWGIYAALWKNSVVREMQFKANFLMWIGVEGLWFGLQLAFIAVIYQHTDAIGTWTKWEVVFLMATAQLIQQLFTAIFMGNLVDLSELVRTGRLDFMLLMPVNARFLVSFRKVDLGGFVNALGAVAVMAYALHQLGRAPGWLEVLGFAVLVGASLVIHYSLMLMLCCTSFWTVRSQGIAWGYYNLFNISRNPDFIFKGGFRIVFTYFLPMLVVANVPSKLVLEKLGSAGELAILPLLGLALLAISEGFWRFALGHYTSASS